MIQVISEAANGRPLKHGRGTGMHPLHYITAGPEDFPELDPDALAATIKRVGGHPDNHRRLTHTVQGPSSFWGHIRDSQHLADTIRDGWREGAEKVLAFSEKLQDMVPMPVGQRRRLRWREQGDSIDMHRVYAGQLDRAWRDMPRQRDRAPRVVSIDVDVCQNGYTSADSLFWCGAAAAALTDLLENAGYRVELFSTAGTQHDHSYSITRIPVKRAQDSMSPSAVAALVALPATFRWYHFMMELLGPAYVDYGFGHATDMRPLLKTLAGAGVIDESEFQISGSLTQDKALENCKRAIALLTAEQDAGYGTMI